MVKTPRLNILGVGVNTINMDMALSEIIGWIETSSNNYICVTPAHGIMECHRNPELKKIFNSSGLTTPDGMSVVWLMRLNGYKYVDRVYGPDLMLAVCKESIKHNWRHFLYGGAPGVPEKLKDILTLKFPGLNITGTYSPPYRALTTEEDTKIIQMINYHEPDIVWVGISTPKQEIWMADHLNILTAPVLVGVGAAFDFLSGNKNQAPRWMQKSGLEWLFRLANEPRRLWRRYAEYPLFCYLVLSQILGIKRYLIE